MVLEGGALGMWLGDEDGALMGRVSAFIKVISQSSLAPSTMRVCNLEEKEAYPDL